MSDAATVTRPGLPEMTEDVAAIASVEPLAEILASECSSDPQKALHEKLSDREYRVMWLLASGKQINEIAKEMRLSASTISTYRTRILRKLKLANNAELVQYAIKHGLVR